jgi:hypothetical protein
MEARSRRKPISATLATESYLCSDIHVATDKRDKSRRTEIIFRNSVATTGADIPQKIFEFVLTKMAVKA